MFFIDFNTIQVRGIDFDIICINIRQKLLWDVLLNVHYPAIISLQEILTWLENMYRANGHRFRIKRNPLVDAPVRKICFKIAIIIIIIIQYPSI